MGDYKMPEITDVSKLRPELLNLAPAEIERRITELQMALEVKGREARKAQLAEVVKTANAHMEAIVAGLRYLDDQGLLSESIRNAHMTEKGVVAFHLKYKPVTADQLVSREDKAAKPKRRRAKI